MAIKKTLLAIVQEILSDLDSEEVNSLSDSIEAQQVATIVESVYYNLISTRDIPEHKELLKPTALSDTNYPTHFILGDNVKDIEGLWYDTSDDNSFDYTEIKWCDPVEFLLRTDKLASNYDTVSDKNGTTKIRIQNNKAPTFFTSLDDEYIILNSYKSTLESTLQESKVRAFGTVFPVFDKDTDTYVPDIDDSFFPFFIAEAKSSAFSILKGGIDQKVEQTARKQRNAIKNDLYRVKRENGWSSFGR